MVTQDAVTLPKVKKMKMKKMKNKKSKKKKAKGIENLDSECEADKLDLDQQVYPLSHYISDQEELVNQMFGTIRGSKLEAMLPPVLKGIPLKELKKLCLHELRGMSKKRILCCINGQMMEGSSGSEDEEEEKEEHNIEVSKPKEDNKGEKRKPSEDQAPESYLLKKIKVEPGTEDGTGGGEGKSVLELLELEMRARIIKTMLEKGDEGKKITEDAIAAVMESAKQITKESSDIRGEEEPRSTVAQPKDDHHQKEPDRDMPSVEERSRRRRRGEEGRRTSHRRHHSARESRRVQEKWDSHHSDDNSHGRHPRKQKDSSNNEKRKKITRKEFEERMKRAKKNRTYRQRKSSEDEDKAEEKTMKEEEPKGNSDDKTDDKKQQDLPKGEDAVTQGSKPDGEISEKEEGEIDSNEEEEGACSPSDISSPGRYSSSPSSRSYSSRSRSRSYSRSPSWSPSCGRQKWKSSSRKRRSRRSYSRSYTRSRSPERRSKFEQRRSHERKGRESAKRDNSKRNSKISPEDSSHSKEEEENWGHKCDIEFVDSEEDFDDHPDIQKKEATSQKVLPASLCQKVERASISFSLQKKPASIAQSVDLDDLPLKKKETSIVIDEGGTTNNGKPAGKEEIVISSDSEVEMEKVSNEDALSKVKKTSDTNHEKTRQEIGDSPSLANTNLQPVTGKKIPDESLVTIAINSQSNQKRQISEMGHDNKPKNEEAVSGSQDQDKESNGTLQRLTIDSIDEAVKKKETEEKTQTSLDVSEKPCPQNQGTSNTVAAQLETRENNNKADFTGKKDNELSVTKVYDNDSECESNSEDSFMEGEKLGDSRETNSSVLPENDSTTCQVHQSRTKASKNSDELCEKKLCNDVISPLPSVQHRTTDDFEVEEKGNNVSECEEWSEINKEKNVQIGGEKDSDSLEVGTNAQLIEEDDSKLIVSGSSSTKENKQERGETGELEDCSIACSERDKEKLEASESQIPVEQKSLASEESKVHSTLEEHTAEDFYRGAEQLTFSEDEKVSEEIDMVEFLKDKTPVEPIRINTGLIRRKVQPTQKIEMVMPEKSWMRKERKKREKSKDVLVMEGVGLLKSTLSESTQSFPKDSELETEVSQDAETVDTTVKEELPTSSLAVTSDTDNSQPAEDSGGQERADTSSKQGSSPGVCMSDDKGPKKIDKGTEIIGVIEANKDSSSDNFDDTEFGGSSWSMRWLQSEKVQKVVTSSKMLSRVRKKIQRKEKATKVVMAEKVEETQKPMEPVIPVIGSIEEYERLFGMKVKGNADGVSAPTDATSLPQDSLGAQGEQSRSSSQSQTKTPEPRKANPVFGSDDDGEDSEEEALWSKIIKK